MNDTKTVAIRLSNRDYERLMDEARQRGVSLNELAESSVRAFLSTVGPRTAEERRQVGLEALRNLAEFRATLSNPEPIDAVELIREGRIELENRFTP